MILHDSEADGGRADCAHNPEQLRTKPGNFSSNLNQGNWQMPSPDIKILTGFLRVGSHTGSHQVTQILTNSFHREMVSKNPFPFPLLPFALLHFEGPDKTAARRWGIHNTQEGEGSGAELSCSGRFPERNLSLARQTCQSSTRESGPFTSLT